MSIYSEIYIYIGTYLFNTTPKNKYTHTVTKKKATEANKKKKKAAATA